MIIIRVLLVNDESIEKKAEHHKLMLGFLLFIVLVSQFRGSS